MPSVLLGLGREERGNVHVMVRGELRQQGQVFSDLVQVFYDAVALAPFPELNTQFRDARDGCDEAVDVAFPTEAGVIIQESEEVRMVLRGGALIPICVPAPILNVDNLACSVPTAQRVVQILEINGRLRVYARPVERQADMVRGVLRQPFGRELRSAEIRSVPLAGLSITAGYAIADVGVVNETPAAV